MVASQVLVLMQSATHW